MAIESFIQIKDFSGSGVWYKIIQQWIENNTQYLEETNFEDSIYWHNEMANVSCMVGAIWKIGGVAVSEITVTKGNKCKDSNRADLYFSVDGLQFISEAKYIREESIKSDKIEQELEKAIRECKSIQNSLITNKMALVFYVPKNECSINTDNIDCDIKVSFKIKAEKKLQYKDGTYNSLYLFGKYSSDS